jgi:hypothetical protein
MVWKKLEHFTSTLLETWNWTSLARLGVAFMDLFTSGLAAGVS